jgi:hypothetical protein
LLILVRMGRFFRLMQRPGVVDGRTSSTKHSGRCMKALGGMCSSPEEAARTGTSPNSPRPAELNLVVDDFVRRRHWFIKPTTEKLREARVSLPVIRRQLPSQQPDSHPGRGGFARFDQPCIPATAAPRMFPNSRTASRVPSAQFPGVGPAAAEAGGRGEKRAELLLSPELSSQRCASANSPQRLLVPQERKPLPKTRPRRWEQDGPRKQP